ncbi:MAG TPA: branched-chain amino acid ABC transporter permease [Acidimicrobiales bacterium]|nr:branched-chain amino acid ABC transporter permease [Acidimicrobiales bacterium]
MTGVEQKPARRADGPREDLRRVGRGWNRLTGRAGRRWRRLPIPVKAVVVLVVYLALAILVPSNPVAHVMAPQSGWSNVLSEEIGVYVLMAIGLNVVVGQAGMLDLGYVAFFAVGGYSIGILTTHDHLNFWEILPIGIAAAALAGLLLGAPTLRLRGDYLAIVTLGFGLIISQAATNLNFDGGAQGISAIPHPPSIGHIKAFTYGVTDFKPYWYLVLAGIFAAIWAVRRLERSRVGRAWVAIREDEDVAELMGVPTYKMRLWAFAIGAAVGGAGGVFFATQANHIDPTLFSYQVSILVLAAVVLGGSGNMAGVVLGAFLVVWLPERFRGFDKYRILVFGLALVVMMIFRPEGLLPSRRRRAEMSEPASGGGMGAPLVAPTLEEAEA